MTSMNIVVLCGGLSTERKISLSSGTKICGALRDRGHKAVLVDLFLGLEDMDERIIADPGILFEELPPLEQVVFDGIAPDLDKVRASRRWKSPSLFGLGVLDICRRADVVFIGLHGMNGEDGRVQATFDMLGIPYTGSGYLGAAMTMDKMITKHMVKTVLESRGIHVPGWKEYHGVASSDVDRIVRELSGDACTQAEGSEDGCSIRVPCVVKTPTGGSSVGVVIVHHKEELEAAVRECLRYGNDLLVEEYIEGREFTCAVLEDRALPSVEIAPKTNFYDYTNKYRAGATEEICPGRCSAEVEELMHTAAVTVHRTMGLSTYSRSDFIITRNDEVYFLEVNTLPGMTPTSLVPQEAAAVGISYGELCEMIVQDALKMRGGQMQ